MFSTPFIILSAGVLGYRSSGRKSAWFSPALARTGAWTANPRTGFHQARMWMGHVNRAASLPGTQVVGIVRALAYRFARLSSIAKVSFCFKCFRIGFRRDPQERSPTSRQLAELWRCPTHLVTDRFSPERCLFQFRFPVDKRGAGYVVPWNAFR